MADIWFDVDAALSEVPVNIFPLTDDTDFKTRETSVAYNATGMDLVWNFVTTSGAYTQTAVTPTTSGAYDWTHQGDGMYSIEIPASGGASINNDTEGFGWFTGMATGVLPWRSPVFGFRAAGINNKLIDDAYDTARGLAGTALPAAAADAAGGLPISDAGALDLDTQLATLTNGTYGLSAIETLVDDLESRLTATRAANLDELGSANIPADIDTLLSRITAAVALNSDMSTLLTRLSALRAGYFDNLSGGAVALASGVTVTTNNDKTGYSLSSAGVTAVQSGLSTLTAQQVWEYATRTLSAFGFSVTVGTNSDKTGYSLSATPPTAAAIADAVWDEATSGHTGTGSAGAAIIAAGSAGDPWSATLPGAYGSGTAGNIIGNRVDAAISTRLATSGYTSPPSASDIATAVWGYATRTLSSFGTLVSDIATAVWGATTRTLSAFGFTVAATVADKTGYSLSSASITSIQSGLAKTTEITALNDISVTDILAGETESGLTLKHAIQIITALALKATGGGTSSISFRNYGDTKNRLTMTVDEDGNRTAVTISLD